MAASSANVIDLDEVRRRRAAAVKPAEPAAAPPWCVVWFVPTLWAVPISPPASH